MSNENVESLDVSAKTVDEAIEEGLAQLNLSRDQVDIVILKEGKRGVFGLGSEDALIRLTPRRKPSAEKPPKTADPPSAKLVADASDQKEVSTSAEKNVESDETSEEETVSPPPSEDKIVEELAVNFLSDLLKLMGIEAEITPRIGTDLVEPDEEPPLTLNITGKDLGILIGRRSETLRALQYMLRLMVSKEMKSWQSIVVDVESYRVRRRRSLRRMAEQMAERAVANQKRVVLEAMPAYERRLVHVALKDHPAVFTKSIGSDENRKVTIIPK